VTGAGETVQHARVRATYAAIAPAYRSHEHPLFWQLADALLESLLRRWVPATAQRCLDLAGGDGRWSEWLFTHTGAAPVLIDLSPEMAALAERRMRARTGLGGWRADLGPAEALPYRDQEFDVLICLNNALGLFARPDEALRELARVLRPGGRAILGACRPAPCATYLRLLGYGGAAAQVLATGAFRAPWGTHLIRTFTPEVLGALLEACDLEGLRDVGFPRDLVPHAPVERWLARSNPARQLEEQMAQLGEPGDDMAYSRLLLVQRRAP